MNQEGFQKMAFISNQELKKVKDGLHHVDLFGLPEDGKLSEYHETDKYRLYLEHWLHRYPWEWFLSLGLENGNYERPLRRFFRDLQKKEKIQVAYTGVYNALPSPHLHILALGYSNKTRKRLAHVNTWIWEWSWRGITQKSSDIQRVTSDGAAGYIAFQNTPQSNFELVTPYNRKLLMKKEKDGMLAVLS